MAAYAHSWQKIGVDHYRLSWVIDFRYPTSRLRFPRQFTRDTDEIGAMRFSKKWKITAPIAENK